jgi:hypothetical protein
MSRLEWLLLFLVFVVYVVLGGVVLMHFEGHQEQAQRALELQQTRQLQGMRVSAPTPHPQSDLNARRSFSPSSLSIMCSILRALPHV